MLYLTQKFKLQPIFHYSKFWNSDIEMETELRGGFAALAKKGTIRFASYKTTEKQ